MEIVYVYQKQRKDFGRAPKFSDVEPDTLDETVPNPDQVAAARCPSLSRWALRARRTRTVQGAAVGPCRQHADNSH